MILRRSWGFYYLRLGPKWWSNLVWAYFAKEMGGLKIWNYYFYYYYNYYYNNNNYYYYYYYSSYYYYYYYYYFSNSRLPYTLHLVDVFLFSETNNSLPPFLGWDGQAPWASGKCHVTAMWRFSQRCTLALRGEKNGETMRRTCLWMWVLHPRIFFFLVPIWRHVDMHKHVLSLLNN